MVYLLLLLCLLHNINTSAYNYVHGMQAKEMNENVSGKLCVN